MNKLRFILISFLLSGCCASEVTVKSPDGNLKLTLNIDDGVAGAIYPLQTGDDVHGLHSFA